MRNYPFEKYKFIVVEESGKVIAITHDCGKVVRGVAVCSPGDTFDIDYGKKLAAARANMKVAIRRKRRAESRFEKTEEMLNAAKALYKKDKSFVKDANKQYDEAVRKLTNL